MTTKAAPESAPRYRQWLHRLRVASILASDRAVAVLLLLAALLVRINDPYPVELTRLKVFDYYQLTKLRPLTQRPVTIVDLDEESMASVGQWPWPRTVIAELVNRLTKAGAVVVGFDMAFPEPDRLSPERISRSVGGLDDATMLRLKSLPSSDTLLAETLKNSRTVLGQFAYEREIASIHKRAPLAAPMAEIGEDPRGYLPIHLGMVRNIAELEQAAAGLGMVTLLPESDGVVRRVPAVVRVGDRIFPSLSVEMLRIATGGNAYAVRTSLDGLSDLVVAGQRIPTDSQGRIWVYFSASDPARYISAGDILRGKKMSPDLAPNIAGKLVLVGTSAIGLRDLRPTPIDARLPGVEVHANLIETILSQQHLKRPAEATLVELLAAFAAGLFIIVLVPLVGPIWTFPLFLGIGAALVGTSYYLFADQRLMADATFPILSTFLIYILLTYANYSREAAEKRRVRDAFRHYMSPVLVEQLARNPDQLRLGGETRDMTLLFCDVRSFTSICEGLDAAGVTRMLNRFLTPMTDIVLSHNGTIDKYMGDAIMAFWNAPVDVKDHAGEACQAAFEMLTRLRDLNDELAAEAKAEGRKQIPLRVGIGINTGPCMVGNMGSEQRFDYSVLGDDVNLASRLEGLSKVYEVPIIVSEATIGLAAKFDSLELDVVRVKGKVRPVRIYALFSRRMLSAIPDFWDFSEIHDSMLNAYRGQDWPAAKRYLARCRQLSSGGAVAKLYDLYDERISAYEAEPPGVDWDGVYVATSK